MRCCPQTVTVIRLKLDMDISLLILAGLVIAGFALLYLQLTKNPKRNDDSTLQLLNDNFNARMKEIAEQFARQTKEVNSRLRENTEMVQKSNHNVGERLDSAAKVVGGVTEKLAKMEEASKRIFEVGKDISSLQDILRAPKLRGNLGEFFLGDLLNQYFSKDQISMPYTFRSGEKVDAAIHLADKRIVPIDAKFPLENFKKMIETKEENEKKIARKLFIGDVKKRIDEIAKYILPDEGTLDFALLYIPAENVYYEVIVKDDGEDNLSSYAFKKRVIPVSPNNFFVYIQTVLMGLRGLQVEKGARDMIAAIGRLKGDFTKFGEDFDVLGNHLTNANNKFEDSKRRFEKIEQKVDNIELLSSEENVKTLK